jgi:hypothetical protein
MSHDAAIKYFSYLNNKRKIRFVQQTVSEIFDGFQKNLGIFDKNVRLSLALGR